MPGRAVFAFRRAIADRLFPREIAGDQILPIHKPGGLAACKPACLFRAAESRGLLLSTRERLGKIGSMEVEKNPVGCAPAPHSVFRDGSVFGQAGAKLNCQLFI
jgi:hypothetical protein